MQPIAWLTATIVAGITMVSVASTYVYTRNEGVLLERRLDGAEQRIEKVDDELKRRLDRIEDKLDRAIQINRR